MGGHRLIAPSELRRYLHSKGMPLPSELLPRDGRLRLLVVDDDELLLRALGRQLKAPGLRVALTATTSPVEALLLLSHLRPDVMLVDLQMPLLDGFELCQKVRAFPSLAGVQLLMMTGSDLPHLEEQAVAAGAAGLIRKPFTPGQLLEFVRSASRPATALSPRARLGQRAQMPR